MFDKFSERARQLVLLACLKAGQRGSREVEIEDLLTAFIIEDQGGFVDTVSRGQGDITWVIQKDSPTRKSFLTSEIAGALLAQLNALDLPCQAPPNSAEIPLSQASQNALSRVDSFHNEMHHGRAEPLHVLAAILEDQSCKAAQIFGDAGITREEIVPFLEEKQQSHG